MEDVGVTTSPQDKTFLEQYSNSHLTRLEYGSYSTKFPWKDDHPPPPSNYFICEGRARSLVHRLAQTAGMLQTYDNILKEQVDRGFIEEVTPTDSSTALYIPHHPVKKDSSTTPVRIIYNCSCHGSANQPSLNDCLLTGPPFLIELVSIILRFRLNKYGFQQISRRRSFTLLLMPRIVILLDFYGFLIHPIPTASLTHTDFAECFLAL